MCKIVFEKAKSRGGTVNRTSDYAEVAARSGSKKMFSEKFRKIDKKLPVKKSLF